MSRILVVEDETHLAEGLRFNLEQEGYSVQVTGNGEEALEAGEARGARGGGLRRGDHGVVQCS